MIFHKTLDTLLATWSHIAVLRTLQDSVHGLTGREIARQSGMNHRSCLRALTTLEELSLVTRQRGGRDHLFTFNREHILVSQGIIPLLALERRFIQDFTDFLSSRIGKRAESIILFGSVARKQETLASDVDLCIIVRRVNEKEKIQSIIHDSAEILLRRYGARVSPLIFTLAEFSSKARQKKPPVQEILEEGVVIKGKSLRRHCYDAT
ncbi:MAG: nucleotidyltransferase domain-containing protein [bacterium]